MHMYAQLWGRLFCIRQLEYDGSEAGETLGCPAGAKRPQRAKRAMASEASHPSEASDGKRSEPSAHRHITQTKNLTEHRLDASQNTENGHTTQTKNRHMTQIKNRHIRQNIST